MYLSVLKVCDVSVFQNNFFPGITQHFTFCVSVFLAPVICILSLCSSLKLLPFYSDHTTRSGWNSPQEWLWNKPNILHLRYKSNIQIVARSQPFYILCNKTCIINLTPLSFYLSFSDIKMNFFGAITILILHCFLVFCSAFLNYMKQRGRD